MRVRNASSQRGDIRELLHLCIAVSRADIRSFHLRNLDGVRVILHDYLQLPTDFPGEEHAIMVAAHKYRTWSQPVAVGYGEGKSANACQVGFVGSDDLGSLNRAHLILGGQ